MPNKMTLANVLTISRISMVPIFAYTALKYTTYYLPGIIYTICILTDIIDGFVARIGKQRTSLGALLDPVADKLLILTAYIILPWVTIGTELKMPLWLTSIVFSRELLIVIGWLVIYILTHSAKVYVRFSGKVSTFIQMVTVWLLLFNFSSIKIFFYITAITTLLSTVDYIYKTGIRVIFLRQL